MTEKELSNHKTKIAEGLHALATVLLSSADKTIPGTERPRTVVARTAKELESVLGTWLDESEEYRIAAFERTAGTDEEPKSSYSRFGDVR